ncbi:MAG: hypothetical protein JW787_06030 [Sedimentisphaerales bacterium]|nr:hypothetical protein [Sedimentisphaerales bacterium]
MKKFKAHLIAIGIVTIWAVFAYIWLNVEDGSSGLGILGMLSAVFFIPGGFLMQITRGSHSNADIPFMAIISWFIFTLIALAIAQVAAMILNSREAK